MRYPKINTLFKRDEKGIIIPNEFTTNEFDYLQDNLWECTEKIDGTNIHTDLLIEKNNSSTMTINGRNEESQIPKHLLSKLESIFKKDDLTNFFSQRIETMHISIFGEGHGDKIQTHGKDYISNDVDFMLFDININGIWLERNNLQEIANSLSLKIVPYIGCMTLNEAIEYAKAGFISKISENRNLKAEGFVLKTMTGLLDRQGNRITTKLKTRDFEAYDRAYGK